jgi:WD40 repeat protein
MRTANSLGLLLASWWAVFPAAATAGLPESGPMPHLVDQYGDPLPDGAVARLGSVRLRHPGLADFTLLPDGKTAVTVGKDQMVRWWDLDTGRQTRAVPFRADSSREMVISPDGTRIAINEPYGKSRVVVRDTASGRIIQTATASYGLTESLSFSHDGSALAFGGKASLLTRLSVRTGRSNNIELGTPHEQHFGPFLPCLSASFSRDGRRIVAGGIHEGQHTIAVIDAADMSLVFSATAKVQAQALSPDGNRLVACLEWTEGTKAGCPLREYDLKTGKEVDRFLLDIVGRCTSLEFSPDVKSLICTDWVGVQVLDSATGRVRLRVPLSGRARMSENSRLLAVQDGPRLRLWDVASGREMHDRPGAIHTGALAVSADGNLVATEDESANAIDVWHTASGRRTRQLAGEKKDIFPTLCPLEDMAFSANADRLVVCDTRDAIRSWDLATGTAARPVTLPDSDHENYAERKIWFQIAPGGRRVAAVLKKMGRANRERTLSVWDTETGKVLLRRPVDPGLFGGCAWSPDGLALAVLGSDRVVLLDPQTGRELYSLPTSRLGSFSTDSRLLVCWNDRAKEDDAYQVRVSETATGRPVAIVSRMSGSTTSLGVASSARAVVTADEQYLRVYDLVTGKERGRRALPNLGRGYSTGSPVREIRLLPGDRCVLTTLADGTALVWDLTGFPPPFLSDKHGDPELQSWWDDLAGEDAARAYTAGWKLTETPAEDLVKFLRARVRPNKPVNPEEVRKLIADLDSPTFAAREVAARRLWQIGPVVLSELRKRPPGISAEAVERLTKLEERLLNPIPPAETLRVLRTIAVLERVETADSRNLLDELTGGPAGAPETKAARSALDRMKWKSVKP